MIYTSLLLILSLVQHECVWIELQQKLLFLSTQTQTQLQQKLGKPIQKLKIKLSCISIKIGTLNYPKVKP